MYDARTKLADQVVSEVRDHFGDKVLRTIVPRTVRLSEAPSFGQPIIAFDPRRAGAIAYRERRQGGARWLAAAGWVRVSARSSQTRRRPRRRRRRPDEIPRRPGRRPTRNQPRVHFDEEALADLAASIPEIGVLQPVLVRPRRDGSTS